MEGSLGDRSRSTRQKRLILHILREAGPHHTIDEICTLVWATNAHIARSTVYRVLEASVRKGEVVAARVDKGPLRYEMEGESHPHAVCEVCGRVAHLPSELLERLDRNLRDVEGFRRVRADITVVGVCCTCARLPEAASPATRS